MEAVEATMGSRAARPNQGAFKGLLVSAALGLTACGGGGTSGPAAPSAPPPPTSFTAWVGSAVSSERRESTGRDSTLTFEGTVTWQKQDDLAPSRPRFAAGAVRYGVASGRLHVALRGTRTFISGNTCTFAGDTDVALGPSDPAADFLVNSLDVAPDGQYVGSLHQDASLRVVWTCPGQATSPDDAEVSMSLPIRGSLIGGRQMQGQMPPDTGVGVTKTGGWDFTAR
jgi:hypothetical protein